MDVVLPLKFSHTGVEICLPTTPPSHDECFCDIHTAVVQQFFSRTLEYLLLPHISN